MNGKLIKRYWPHALSIAVLVVVLLAYMRPDFMAQVANLVWLCFK